MSTVDEPLHLAVTEVGAGAPNTIVFTHGWADDRSVWQGVIDALGDDVHSVAWDLRAHGESDAAEPGRYTRDHALADLERIVTGAGVPVFLGGHSLGGYLSLAYTLVHPEQVRGLILVAAGPGFRNPETREQWNESVDASAAKLDVPEGSEMLSKHVDSWVIDSLGEIDAPVLVLVGERDKRFQASAAVFEKNLDVRMNVTVTDAGHNVHKSQPGAVAAAIREFLAQVA